MKAEEKYLENYEADEEKAKIEDTEEDVEISPEIKDIMLFSVNLAADMFARPHTCETVQDVIRQKEKELKQRMRRK